MQPNDPRTPPIAIVGGEPVYANRLREHREEEFVRDELREHSPDGMPPTTSVRRTSIAVLALVAILCLSAVVGAAAFLGGLAAAAIALLVIAGYFLIGAWPAWDSAVQRKKDEMEARDIVEEERPFTR